MRLRSHVRLVGLVALAGLVVGLALLLHAELGPLQMARAAAADVRRQAVLAELIHELQRERGLSTMWLAGAAGETALAEQQRRSDAAAARATALGILQSGDLFAVSAHRHQLAIGTTDTTQIQAIHAAAIGSLLRRYVSRAAGIELATLRAPLLSHMALLRANEQLGQLRTIVADQLARGRTGTREVHRALQQFAVFDAAVAVYIEEAGTIQGQRMHDIMEAPAMRQLHGWMADMDAASPAHPLPSGIEAATAWFAVASAATDELHALAMRSIDEERAHAERLVATSRTRLLWRTAFLVIGWAAACWVVFLSLRRLLGTIQRLTRDTRALLGRIEGVTDGGMESLPVDLDVGFMDLIERVDELSMQATTDALTGTLNRHGLAPLFQTERLRALRHGRALSLVMLDIDHFKNVNDEYGHTTGDEVLRDLATLLRHIVRAEDIIARWGGEEFVVVAPECDEHAAATLAEKLRMAVATHSFRLPCGITASFGVVQLESGDDLERLVARADAAMYRAKALGRNRVCRASVSGSDDEPPRLRVVPR